MSAEPEAGEAPSPLLAEPAGPDEEIPARPPFVYVPKPPGYPLAQVAPVAHIGPGHGPGPGDEPYSAIDPFAPYFESAQIGPLDQRIRVLCVLAGALLFVVFLLDWSGARSWELMRVLRGLDYARQISFLIAGSVLFSAGALPVPPLFRAGIGALCATVPLFFGGTQLNFWQGILAVLAVTLLPASLLLRTQIRHARLPRSLGLAAIAALVLLYISPTESGSPLQLAIDLIYRQKDNTARFLGTYLLLPLPLLGLSALALVSSDVAVIGELLGWLLLCWGPGALLVLQVDHTQVYMAASLLCYSICAAYCLAELFRRISYHSTLRGHN